MVVFVVNDRITELLRAAGLEPRCVKHSSNFRTISHGNVIMALKATGRNNFVSAVAGVELHATHEAAAASAAGPPPRSLELEARLARLRAQNELAEYTRIVQDIRVPHINPAKSDAESLARFGSQMSIGVNVIVTMATCFVAGYFVFRHSSGSEAMGLIGGLICMIAALIVEATLVITRLYSVERAASKQNAKERREAKDSRIILNTSCHRKRDGLV